MSLKKVKVNIVLNKSSTYLLPLVSDIVNFEFLHLLKNSYVINNEEEGAFCVLYKFSGKPEFTNYEKTLMQNHLFVGHEDYDEYVLYKFRLSKNMQDALLLFSDGKYSLFDESHKKSIIKFMNKRGFTNAGKIRKILDRDESLRKEMEINLGTKINPNDELSSPPDMQSENFKNSVKYIDYNTEIEDEGEEC